MDGRTDRWMEEWTDGWMDGKMDRWIDEHLEIYPCALQNIGPLGPLPKHGRGYIGESILSLAFINVYLKNFFNFERLSLLNELSYRPQLRLILKS